LERLKGSATAPAISLACDVEWRPGRIESGNSSIVELRVDSESHLIARKTGGNAEFVELIRREAAILHTLRHPLVLEMRGQMSERPGRMPSIVTAPTRHGLLATHLSLGSPNQTTKVIIELALAILLVHSRGVIHRDPTPANILLDWDWTV
jgi:serine/threonine protein kinase